LASDRANGSVRSALVCRMTHLVAPSIMPSLYQNAC
jgi:hypothetical protein